MSPLITSVDCPEISRQWQRKLEHKWIPGLCQSWGVRAGSQGGQSNYGSQGRGPQRLRPAMRESSWELQMVPLESSGSTNQHFWIKSGDCTQGRRIKPRGVEGRNLGTHPRLGMLCVLTSWGKKLHCTWCIRCGSQRQLSQHWKKIKHTIKAASTHLGKKK